MAGDQIQFDQLPLLTKLGYGFLGICVVIAITILIFSPSGPVLEVAMMDVYQKVISDSEAQYKIVSKRGNEIESSVQAGFVAAAYLQAKDSAGFNRWKDIEDSHRRKAGLQ